MIHVGTVKKVTGDALIIEFYKDVACTHCSGCNNKIGNTIKMDIPPNKKFSVGQKITLEINDTLLLKISIITYIIPAIFMILGYFFSNNILEKNENTSIVFSFLFLIISFFGVYFYDKKRVRKYGSDIKIIDDSL